MRERTHAVGGAPDDVGFLKGLVADLVRRGISDPTRIYLAGSSNGSFMTLRMICADAGMFAAVGLLAGGMPELVGANCRPAKPIPVMMINGTADQIVPYSGGMVQPGNAFNAWPTEGLVEFFRRLDGCSAAAQQSVLPNAGPNRVEVTRWTDCAGAPVVFYRIVGAGHDAPWAVNVGELLLGFFRENAGG
jgi:polyhydroxybutyrate depolymerase